MEGRGRGESTTHEDTTRTPQPQPHLPPTPHTTARVRARAWVDVQPAVYNIHYFFLIEKNREHRKNRVGVFVLYI